MGGPGVADQDEPFVRLAGLPGPSDGGSHRVEDVSGLWEEHSAAFGQAHAAAVPVEQRCSSCRMARDSGGWLMRRRSAARPKWSSSATAVK